MGDVWRIARWSQNREPQSTLIPPLQHPDGQLETDAARKLELFKEAFFPPPPEVDLSDIKDYRYPSPLHFPPITWKDVAEAIRKMAGRKAPGKGTIPSHLLHCLASEITTPLMHLYNTCLWLHYCPQHFGESVSDTPETREE